MGYRFAPAQHQICIQELFGVNNGRMTVLLETHTDNKGLT